MSDFKRVEEDSAMKTQPSFNSWWSRRSRRSKMVLAIVLPVIILGLALGLGLGLTIGQRGNDNSSLNLSSTSSPHPTTPASGSIWQPKVESTWQIVLLQPIQIDSASPSITPDVDVYDIDLFDNPKSTIDAFHKLGKKVVCYFSAGSYEPNRPDSASFKSSDKGKELDGWPGEFWLQLSSTNVREIMGKRLELAASKGCDGVDPDNVDGFDNDNGLNLTPDGSIYFINFLAAKAQTLNLAIGLKNAAGIVSSVLGVVQYSINEQCVVNSECTLFSGFINASKPVFHIEYPDDVKDANVRSQLCGATGAADGARGFSTVRKNMSLDGYVQYCNGSTFSTPLIAVDG